MGRIGFHDLPVIGDLHLCTHRDPNVFQIAGGKGDPVAAVALRFPFQRLYQHPTFTAFQNPGGETIPRNGVFNVRQGQLQLPTFIIDSLHVGCSVSLHGQR